MFVVSYASWSVVLSIVAVPLVLEPLCGLLAVMARWVQLAVIVVPFTVVVPLCRGHLVASWQPR